MAKILTGVQSTGTPHLGNLLGAIIPAIELSNNPANESFLFIADLHSVTQIKNGETLRANTYSTAAAWLACGLNVEKVVFYRQSDVPQTAELSWYLSCFFPFQRLTLAHSFKDKSDRLDDVNAGLFSYPTPPPPWSRWLNLPRPACRRPLPAAFRGHFDSGWCWA